MLMNSRFISIVVILIYSLKSHSQDFSLENIPFKGNQISKTDTIITRHGCQVVAPVKYFKNLNTNSSKKIMHLEDLNLHIDRSLTREQYYISKEHNDDNLIVITKETKELNTVRIKNDLKAIGYDTFEYGGAINTKLEESLIHFITGNRIEIMYCYSFEVTSDTCLAIRGRFIRKELLKEDMYSKLNPPNYRSINTKRISPQTAPSQWNDMKKIAFQLCSDTDKILYYREALSDFAQENYDKQISCYPQKPMVTKSWDSLRKEMLKNINVQAGESAFYSDSSVDSTDN